MNDAFDTHSRAGNPPGSSFEERLISMARTFSYPPFPNVSARVVSRLALRHRQAAPRRRLALAIILLAVLAVIFAVPPVRAAIIEWIRIGAVRIFAVQPTPALTPSGQATPTPLASILDLSGETKLNQAQAQSFPLRLPAYPPDLGQPDHVYLQEFGGPVVMLVWMDQNNPGEVRLAISETNVDGAIFQKIVPPSIEYTTVNGQEAMWVDSPYMLITGSGDYVMNRLIATGHTLIWTEGQMTFRLETGADLATAIKMAESLRTEP